MTNDAKGVALLGGEQHQDDLKFGLEAPQALRDAFGEIQTAYAPFAGEFELQAGTEVAGSAVPAIATLDRSGRLVDDLQEERIRVLLGQWTHQGSDRVIYTSRG
ncbi:hypothetical protein [Nocardia sp. NPDC049707]|uniref:hypothetical protein n=1 Tax=Nocardia sp. NPDC049707 TaxID=3154735 RepID=UPI0034470BAF